MRRLAAIGAADVLGYLRLIEADEGTLLRLRSPRHWPIDPTLALRKGRTLKTGGGVEAALIAAG